MSNSNEGGPLAWPAEPASTPGGVRLAVPGSNLVLDLHGSLLAPDLVLFMAGNQFRVLPPLLAAFAARHGPKRIFYATTPPGLLLDAMAAGRLDIGNLMIELGPGALWPDVFMAGPREHARLAAAGRAGVSRPYARNRGMALLVRRGNPRGVRGVPCLARADVRVAMSSPQREAASFASYAATLNAQGGAGFAEGLLAKPDTWHPQAIHHREVPQRLADGRSDAAPLYRHLADYVSSSFPDLFEFVDLPEAGNARDELSATVLTDAPRPDTAAAWCDFLRGPEAASLLQAHGFDPAP